MNIPVASMAIVAMLTGMVVVLHYVGLRISRQFLRIFLGALAALIAFRIQLSAGLLANLTLPAILSGISIPYSIRFGNPVLYFAVLLVYIFEGTRWAAILILGLLLVVLTTGVLLPLVVTGAIVTGGFPREGFDFVAGLLAPRQQVAEALSFALGLYFMVLAYQFLVNRLPRRISWLAAVAGLLLGGLAQGTLYAFGANFGEAGWAASQLAGEWIGWLLATIVITPIMILYFRFLQHREQGAVWIMTRPTLDVLQSTISLQDALEISERQVAVLNDDLRLLTEVRRSIVRGETPVQLSEDVCQILLDSRRFPLVWIGMTTNEPEKLRLQAVSAFSGKVVQKVKEAAEAPFSIQGAFEVALQKGSPTIMDEESIDDWEHPLHTVAAEAGIDHAAIIPMNLGKYVAGVLTVYVRNAETLDRTEIRMLQGVADDLARALSRLQVERNQQQTVRQLNAIREITAEMISQIRLPELLETIVRAATMLLNTEGGEMFLKDDIEDDVIRCAISLPHNEKRLLQVFRSGEGAAGRVFESGAPLVIDDYMNWSGRAPLIDRKDTFSLLSAPMIWQDSVIGVVNVWRDSSESFDPDDLDLLTLFASQSAMALENARLLEKTQTQVRQFMLLNELTRISLSAEDIQSSLDVLADHMTQLIEADECHLTLWDAESQVELLTASTGGVTNISFEADQDPEQNSLTLQVLRQGKPLAVDNLTESRFQSNLIVRQSSASSVLALPLAMAEDPLGAVILTFNEPHKFSAEEITVSEQAAAQVAFTLAKLKAIDSESRRRAELEAVRKASLDLTSSLELEPLLQSILEHALNLVQAGDAHIFLYDGKKLNFGAALWQDERGAVPFAEPREDGLTYTVARSGEQVMVADISNHPLFTDMGWGGSIIGIPLLVGKRVLGVMNIASEEVHIFDEDEQRALGLLADQAAIAIENARLFEATEGEKRSNQLLYDLTRELASTLDEEEISKRAVELIRDTLGGLACGIAFLEGETNRMRLKSLAGEDPFDLKEMDEQLELKVGEGLVGWAAEYRKPVLVPNVLEDPRWDPKGSFNNQVRSVMYAPIQVSGELLGVIALLNKDENAYQGEHLDLLIAISRQVGLALTNARRYQQTKRQLAEITAIQQVAQVATRELELDSLLKEVVVQVGERLGYPVVDITLVDGDELVLQAAYGMGISPGMDNLRVPLAYGIIGRVASQNQAAFVEDVTKDPEFRQWALDAGSEIAVPLRKKDLVIGVLNVESPEIGGLTKNDLRTIELLAGQVSVAIENVALYDRLRDQAAELEQTVADRTLELAQALEQAREADRLKSLFVTDVSHELRTPLSNIRLYLDLLAQGRTERFQTYLDTLDRETNRLVSLIEDLLAISRLDAGSAPIHAEPLSLNTLAESLVEDRQRLYAERDIELSFEPEKTLPDVIVDQRMISQVVANLMTNAMNYTATNGKVSISTELIGREGDEWVTLTVADDGLGISNTEQSLLFKRFFRGEASRKMGNPGTGLGLAICKEILERHDGWITVRSQLGEGSAFTIWLPPAGEQSQMRFDFPKQAEESG